MEDRIRYHLEQIRIEAVVTAVDLKDAEIVHEFETIFRFVHVCVCLYVSLFVVQQEY